MNPFCNVFLSVIVCGFLIFPKILISQQERMIMHQGTQRSFIHYTPTDYQPDSTYPLVLILHGFTQSADDIMDYSGFNALAEEHDFIAVYPNGVNNAWNTQSGFPGGSTAPDIDFLATLIDLLLDEQSIDPQRVYACGFSAGGFMSYILACELQDRLAAIASVAGTYSRNAFNACQPDRPFPILHIHGTDDLIVPPGGSLANIPVQESLEFWRNHNGCPVNPEISEGTDDAGDGTRIEQLDYRNCQASSAIQYLRVINGGHTWPGAPPGSGLGTTTENLDASVAIWDFFSQFEAPISTQVSRSPIDPIQVFPNPAHHQIEIQVPSNSPAKSLRIFRIDGKEMIHRQLNGSNLKIDISQWPSGQYWIQLEGRPAISWLKV